MFRSGTSKSCGADARGYDAFLSAGIGDDASFEADVLALHSQLVCHAYDTNIDPASAPRGLCCLANPWAPSGRARHSCGRWTSRGPSTPRLAAQSDADLGGIEQLSIELHHPFSGDRMEVLQRLETAADLVHLHGNKFNGMSDLDGPLPEVVEATFVRKGEVGTWSRRV